MEIMEIINGRVQVYKVWVMGRLVEDENQYFPVDANIDSTDWNLSFKKAIEDYFSCVVENKETEFGLYSDIYKDCLVSLFSADININDFENMFDTEFDPMDENFDELISNYVDFVFNTVSERIIYF